MTDGMLPIDDSVAVLAQVEKYLEAVDSTALKAGVADNVYFELSALQLPDVRSASDVLDERSRLNLLKQLGTVVGVQGTSRVSLEPSRKQTQAAILAGAKALLLALSGATGGEVTKEQADKAVAASGAASINVINVLKILELVAGVKGRTGGVRLAARAAADVQKAEKEFAASSAKAASEEAHATTATEHEEVYYSLAADAMQIEGFAPTVTGVRQRARGEWSTPDVVGFYTRTSKALVVPVVRIGTVEVKHRLSRSGIAEACAHRRFAHYAYIAVAEVFTEIAAELREECVRSGVGLMCFKQRNSVAFQLFIEPLLNRPDEEFVEELLTSLDADDERPIADHVFEEVRVAMGQALFR